jgi:outer membrane protein assembly factor BamB
MMRARWVTLLGMALTAMTAAACTGGGGTSQPVSTLPGITRTLDDVSSPVASSGSANPAAAWPTYNRDLSRDGVAVGVRSPGTLSVAWRDRLDGAVYGQPLLIGNYVVAATENDTVYALKKATGAIVWRTHVGSPVPRSALHGCGDIFPLGITGTPAYDQSNGVVYVVAETTGYRHTLFGLSATNGAVKVKRYIPTPDRQQAWDQQRPALAITGGRAYVLFGGLAGDCGPYKGSVVGVPVSGSGPIISYVTPTAREGAFWGPGGPVVGPRSATDATPTLYVANGNGAARQGDRYDYSDSVTSLSLGLHRLGYFAPATWAQDNANDLDLGSTQPALGAGGAVFIVGKRGTAYLLQAGSLGGVGSQRAQADVCAAYGTMAVTGSVVYVPCRSFYGVTAVRVSVAAKEIQVLWHGPSDADGSPVIGGGAVWVTDWGTGKLYALDAATGAVLRRGARGGARPPISTH